jgi:hypothetical protein
MYLKYGGYIHAQNGPLVSIGVQIIYGPRSVIELSRQTWSMTEVIHGTNQANLIANMAALQNAYAANGFDLNLFLDDLSTIMHTLPSGSSLGGTRVVSGPMWPTSVGAEGSTFRTATFAVQADYPNTGNNLIDWSDEVEFFGGGPRIAYLEVLEGLPQPQTLVQNTTYKASQSGHSVGMFGYAPIAPPIFPAYMLPDRTRLKQRSPRRVGPNFRDWISEWHYEFESTSPLEGLPTIV